MSREIIDTEHAVWVTHAEGAMFRGCPLCQQPAAGSITLAFWVNGRLVERSLCLPCFVGCISPEVKQLLIKEPPHGPRG